MVKPATVPLPPTALQAISVTTGVEVRWINPPGAEPWPTPAPAPSPTPSPLPLPAQGVAPDPEPSPPKAPSSPAAPPPSASAILLPPTRVSPPPAASAPSPTPLPTPPTGIRIFRTDGIPRLAGPPLQASTWLDPSPRVCETACYALRYATSFKPVVESAPTDPVCVEMKDVAPPEPPDKLLGDLGDGFVELSWAASPSSDVAAYRIYKTTDSRPRALLLETQGPVLRVRDSSTGSGVRTYEAVALDKSGNESKPTPAIKVIVP